MKPTLPRQVQVRLKHIRNGRWRDFQSCPLAPALQEELSNRFGYEPRVRLTEYWTMIVLTDNTRWISYHSDEVASFVDRFDWDQANTAAIGTYGFHWSKWIPRTHPPDREIKFRDITKLIP